MPTDNEGSVRQLGNAGGNIVDCRCSCQAPPLRERTRTRALLTRFYLRLEDAQPESVTQCSMQAALFPQFG